jgi:hypothetical protein
LISKTIITPGSATGQTLPLAGLLVPDEPERETSTPGEAGPTVAAGSAPLERPPLMSHQPCAIA